MKSLRLLAASLSLLSAQAFAEMVEVPTAGGDGGVDFEVNVESGYIFGGDIQREQTRINDIDEWQFLARFLVLPTTKVGILRLGVEYETYAFDIPEGLQVPDRLQGLAAIIGLDTKLSDSLLIRFEARPGLYSADTMEGRDFSMPFILGGTYLYSSNLQFVFGVGVDYEGEYIVIPGGGLRWRMGPQWVLNATLPTPRLEYELNQNLLLYVGADIKAKNFRVDDDFVGDPGDPGDLNNTILRYTEIRVGGGLVWGFGEGNKLSLEGGYLPYRDFKYHRTEVRYHYEGGAPYAAVSLNLAF